MNPQVHQQKGAGVDEKKFWPFPVIPPDRQTDEHRKEIRFFEDAYREVFKPFEDFAGYGASSLDGRMASLVRRGRTRDRATRWEIFLSAPQPEEGFSCLFLTFEVATEALFRWLRGEPAADLREYVMQHRFW
jgi:hypothetical protein